MVKPSWRVSFLVLLMVLCLHISLPNDTLGASRRDQTDIRALRNARGDIVARVNRRNVVRTLSVHPTYLDPRSIASRRRPAPRMTDPDLKPGFPVQTIHLAGSYHGGPAIHTLVGNIDNDPQLEIVVTALAVGPIYAWNHDGRPVPGFPVYGTEAGYPAIGHMRASVLLSHPERLLKSNHLVVGFLGWATFGRPGIISAYTSNGTPLPGWPINSASSVSTPPTLADVDGVPADEIFVGEEDGKIHAYRHDGSVLPGWPIFDGSGQERHTPAIGDLDGDGDLEIVTTSGSRNPIHLYAYHHDGRIVGGFPVLFIGTVDTFPVIGDIDRDGRNDIIVVGRTGRDTSVFVFSGAGALKRSFTVAGYLDYGTAPALADLDGDGTPEIIVQTEEALNVHYGDGRRFPGWPVIWGERFWMGNSAPVVGDVDGDAQLEIVITVFPFDVLVSPEVRVYNSDGTLHPRFPKRLPIGMGAVPAIADIDRDGRTDIVVCGSYWDGFEGYYDKCWAFDLRGGPHGRIEWGQFGGNASHHGRYPVP
jgi:hypothetical protein